MNNSVAIKKIPGKIYNKLKPSFEERNYDKKYIPNENIVTEIEHKKFVMASKELALQEKFKAKLTKALMEPDIPKKRDKAPFFCRGCGSFLFNMLDVVNHAQPPLIQNLPRVESVQRVTQDSAYISAE